MGAIEVMIEALQGKYSPKLIRLELMTSQHRIPGMGKSFRTRFRPRASTCLRRLGYVLSLGDRMPRQGHATGWSTQSLLEVGRGSFPSAVLQRAELSGHGDRIGNSRRTGRSSGSLFLSNRKFHTADHNGVPMAILDRLALMTAIVHRDLIPAFCNFRNLKDVVKRGVFGYVKSMVELGE